MRFRCLFHVHTHHSFDSLLSPRRIVSKARQLGVDALIVTDHNTIQGSLEARDLAGGRPLVVVAAEYQSEKGDIIGLFLKEEIRSRRSEEIISDIHAQGGLVVLPHPYKGHLLDSVLLSDVDLIESYNARCSQYDNARAEKLARDWKRPALAGADAHCSLELGVALNDFKAAAPRNESDLRATLISSPRKAITGRAPKICRPYSQMVKAAKTRDLRLFLYQVRQLGLSLTRSDYN